MLHLSCEKMTTKLCNIIREYVVVDYDLTNLFFRRGLCASCRVALYSISQNENKRHLNVAEIFDPGLTASTVVPVLIGVVQFHE